ncbi:hypothetical protein PENSUB_957 [Penicillium subrubescens]|uniref:F-box domain-containing protein n=1 Tax=Penicillium subrubescens TaxID=1316194 RepID=A0A1Q5ULI9_9EURO|nr:hypothetical protein PENSUB_957 [Penicillium subrubescens]
MPPTLFQLHAELLFMICSVLPVGSQNCLALTCMTYYTQSKFVFLDKFFNSPHPASEPSGPCEDNKSDPDWEWFTKFMAERELERELFLTRAQTKYWRFCSSCRKLHPEYEFEEKALNEKDENRH